MGESADLSFREANSVGDDMSYLGFVVSRNNPESDDLDPNDENEIQCVRGGGGYGASGAIAAANGAVTRGSMPNGCVKYAKSQQIRIFEDNDNNYNRFTGSVIVNGDGQLTGIRIVNGGDIYNNGQVVYSVGDVDAAAWTAGTLMTCRGVDINDTGVSESETETMTVGN